jgi:hypothetical protein
MRFPVAPDGAVQMYRAEMTRIGWRDEALKDFVRGRWRVAAMSGRQTRDPSLQQSGEKGKRPTGFIPVTHT